MTRDPFPEQLLVGFCGPIGSGKDSCAALLAPFGFTALAFADALRAELMEAFRVDPRLFTDRATKEAPSAELAIDRCVDVKFILAMVERGEDIEIARSPRWLMQRWGTDYRRAQRLDYWTSKAAASIQQLRAEQRRRICVTDVRFPNELQTIQLLGARVVYVYRPNRGGSLAEDTVMHESEPVALARLLPVVHNDGDLEHLRNELVRVLTGPPSR